MIFLSSNSRESMRDFRPSLFFSWTQTAFMLLWKWRRNEINIAVARRTKPEGLSQSSRVLAEGLSVPPHQLGVCGSALSFPSGVWNKAPSAKFFGAFWVLQVSCPAMQNCVYAPHYRGVQCNAFTNFTVHASHNSLNEIYPV